MLIFRKSKMIKRVKEEGLGHLLDEETMSIMNILDGKEALPNLWRKTVYGEEDACYVVVNGEQIPVLGVDCENV